ncbi:MAG: GtrA family protein [Candidatus Colwellbacteria bacterium]|nr:GtrA family protein [Candidatus Colwellbacteria bacterium]
MSKKDLKVGVLAAVLVAVLSFPTVLNLVPSLPTLIQIGIASTLGLLTIVGLFIVKFLSRWLQILWQIGKFAVVGGLNTFVDFGVLNLLFIMSGIAAGFWFGVFKAISFTAAVINSYFWNKYWTFEAGSKKKAEFIEFLGVSLVGLVINVGVAAGALRIIPLIVSGGIESFMAVVLLANLAAFFATFAALVWNFIGYKFIVFRKRAQGN